MKRVISVVLILVSLFLSGCRKASVPEAAPEICAPESGFPVTLTDQAGREVTIEKAPERIVSGYYISTSTLLALGLRERICGLEARADKRNIYRLCAPELIDLPNTGTAKDFSLEGCAALSPDLVILPVKLSEAADALTDLGFKVLLVNPESRELSKGMISLLAKATGTVERGEKLLTFTDTVTDRLSSLSGGPSVYMAGSSAFTRTAGKNMYQSEMIRLAGCTNVADELTGNTWADVGYEQILFWDPELILIAAEASYTVEDVLGNPGLSAVTAVKNGRVYKMPDEIEAWDSPVPGAVLGSLFAAEKAGNGVSEEEVLDTVNEFYETFYGFSIK